MYNYSCLRYRRRGMENFHLREYFVKLTQHTQFMSDQDKYQLVRIAFKFRRRRNLSLNENTHFRSWQKLYMVLWHRCGQNLQGMYHRLAGCCRCVAYNVLSSLQGNRHKFEHSNAPHQCWEGKIKHIIIPPPRIGRVNFGTQNYCCCLINY